MGSGSAQTQGTGIGAPQVTNVTISGSHAAAATICDFVLSPIVGLAGTERTRASRSNVRRRAPARCHNRAQTAGARPFGASRSTWCVSNRFSKNRPAARKQRAPNIAGTYTDVHTHFRPRKKRPRTRSGKNSSDPFCSSLLLLDPFCSSFCSSRAVLTPFSFGRAAKAANPHQEGRRVVPRRRAPHSKSRRIAVICQHRQHAGVRPLRVRCRRNLFCCQHLRDNRRIVLTLGRIRTKWVLLYPISCVVKGTCDGSRTVPLVWK